MRFRLGVHLCLVLLALFAIRAVLRIKNDERQGQQQQQQQRRQPKFSRVLDASPLGLQQCVTLRLRGRNGTESYPIRSKDDLPQYLPPRRIRLGLEFVEDPDQFVSMSHSTHSFHFFHFLEFLVIAMAHLLPLGETQPEIAWLYVPLFTPQEICGVGDGLNCHVLNLMLPSTQLRSTHIHGLSANDPTLRFVHPAYAGYWKHRSNSSNFTLPDPQQQNKLHQTLLGQVDAILFIDRQRCKMEQYVRLHKIWTNYVADFPAHAWHQQVIRRLPKPPPVRSTNKLRVCYIDRQADKRALPEFFHDWILQLMKEEERVQFWHLHMGQYSSLDQVRLAASCNMIVGGHGNGLSHILWMPPSSFVLELGSILGNDYAMAAQLLQHEYLGLLNLYQPMLPWNVSFSNFTMARNKNTTITSQQLEQGQTHIKSFLEHAIEQHQGRHKLAVVSTGEKETNEESENSFERLLLQA